METRISSRPAPIDTSLIRDTSIGYKTPTHLPTPLKLEFELRKFYVAEPNSVASPNNDLDPRLQDALHRIQELENENRILKTAKCPKCSHTLCNMTDPLEGVMSQVNFLKEQYLELRKEYHNYRVRNPPPAKTPTSSGSIITKTPSLSMSETASYSSQSEAATSPSSSPHTSLIKQRSIENWRAASMELSHSPPLDELTLVDEGEELTERETPCHSRKGSKQFTPNNQLSPNRKKSQHKVRSFHYSKAFIKLLGVDPFNRPISTSSTTNSANTSLNYSDTRDFTTRSWCVHPKGETQSNARHTQSSPSNRNFLIRGNSKRFSGLWALHDHNAKASTLPRKSNHLRPPSIPVNPR